MKLLHVQCAEGQPDIVTLSEASLLLLLLLSLLATMVVNAQYDTATAIPTHATTAATTRTTRTAWTSASDATTVTNNDRCCYLGLDQHGCGSLCGNLFLDPDW